MKSIYEIAKMEVIAFEAEDVIATSTEIIDNIGGLVKDDDDFNGGGLI